MYVTAASGLFTYDVRVPDAPRRLGRLPLPHLENEDVDIGRVNGRDIVIITNDPSFNEGLYGSLYVIDVTDAANPTLLTITPTRFPKQIRDQIGFSGASSNNGHIANCINKCQYIWTTGSEEGITIYDNRDLVAGPKFVKTFTMPVPKGDTAPGFTHNVDIDPSGVAWITGEDGTFGYTIKDPLNPKLVYRSDENITNSGGGLPITDGSGPLDFLHHNSLRTSLNLGSRGPARASRKLGNILAVTEEDYLHPGCEGQGSIQTWKIGSNHNSDGTIKLELLDYWTTELNELASASGRSPATGNCSAHWFDEDRGLLAQGWYDQGVRFMDITDPRNIRQVGYYADTGTFWAAYFAPTDPRGEIVYGLDTAGGIDILKINRHGTADGPVPVPSATLPSVSAPATQAMLAAGPNLPLVAHPTFGFACPLLNVSATA